MATFIDLFAGFGGFRKGFELVGHECLGFCEIEETAVQAYRAMFDTEKEWYANDIRTIKAADIPKADIWCAGFPCQDISIAGKKRGLSGDRSGLCFTVTDLIRETEEEDRPKYIVFENVKNLFSINRGFDFARILIELDEIGYDAEWQLLNSKNFGVPQNRERVYIVGHLRGKSTPDVFPIRGFTTGTAKGWQGDVSGKGYGSQQDRVYTYDGITGCLPKARAITKNKVLLPDGTIRVLSARERMRCQGYQETDIDKAIEEVGERAVCELAGNGVTVTITEAIGKLLN